MLAVGDLDHPRRAHLRAADEVIDSVLAKGVEFLFRKNRVDYFVGRAQVSAAGMVEITDGEHKVKFFKTKNVLLATGCQPRQLPGIAVGGERVMTSREA